MYLNHSFGCSKIKIKQEVLKWQCVRNSHQLKVALKKDIGGCNFWLHRCTRDCNLMSRVVSQLGSTLPDPLVSLLARNAKRSAELSDYRLTRQDRPWLASQHASFIGNLCNTPINVFDITLISQFLHNLTHCTFKHSVKKVNRLKTLLFIFHVTLSNDS